MIVELLILSSLLVSGEECDEVCIQMCDPSAPDGCGSYCCKEDNSTETCDCDQFCSDDVIEGNPCISECSCALELMFRETRSCKENCLENCLDETCRVSCEDNCSRNHYGHLLYIGVFVSAAIVCIAALMIRGKKNEEHTADVRYS